MQVDVNLSHVPCMTRESCVPQLRISVYQSRCDVPLRCQINSRILQTAHLGGECEHESDVK